jgi:hypothetical protein
MSVMVFETRDPPLEDARGGSPVSPFNGAGVGYVIEWARKVVGREPIPSSKPRERASRGLALAAQAQRPDGHASSYAAQALQAVWEKGLAQVGLQATSVSADAQTGPQLLQHLCQVIPPGGLCAISIARPAQPGTPRVYYATALMKPHPQAESGAKSGPEPGSQPGPGALLFFDPRFGLYQCDSAEDLAKTVKYLDAYTEPAWAYAIHPVAGP